MPCVIVFLKHFILTTIKPIHPFHVPNLFLQNPSRSVPYGHFTRYPTASPTSMQTSIPSVTFTKLVNYFTTANDQLYNLLDGDVELHHIVYAIKLLQPSNQTLEELQARQELYMLGQFELALQNGLHRWLSPMVVQQRDTIETPAPPSHTMDGSDSQDNWPIHSVIDNYTCPQSLLEWMSLPDTSSAIIIPTPSLSYCEHNLVTGLKLALINRDWRVFNRMKGIVLWFLFPFHVFIVSKCFFFSFYDWLRIYARYAWTSSLLTHGSCADISYWLIVVHRPCCTV